MYKLVQICKLDKTIGFFYKIKEFKLITFDHVHHLKVASKKFNTIYLSYAIIFLSYSYDPLYP